MSSIMKGLTNEGENVTVIYIDDKPIAKYTKKHEAEDNAELIRKKFPNKRIEVKQEVREAEGDTLHDPEYALPEARRITKAIKYDDTVGDIVTQIQMLAERTEGIDSKTLEYSIDRVLSAKNSLESEVYGLEEAFEDAARNAQYKRDDVDEGNYHDNRTGFRRGPRDDERHDLDVQKPSREEWGLKINGKVWSKDGKDVTFASKEQALKARQTLLAKRPELEIGLVTRNVSETLDENLKQWFKEKWVRFGPDGKIRGDCARGDDSEGKPKCLPQSKAQNLGKEGRASAASRKRREDPNPERSGKAINVNTKKKTNEAELDEACWKGYHKEGNKKMFGKTYPNCVKNTNEELDMTEGWKEESQELEDWSKEVNMRLYKAHESQRPALARQLSKIEQKNFGSSLNKGLLTQLVHSTLMALQKGQMVHYDPQSVGQMPFGNIVGDDARIIASSGLKKYDVDGYRGLKRAGMVDTIEQFLHLRDLADNQGQAILKYANMPPVAAWMQFIKDIGWSKDDMNEEVQAKTDDKLLAYYAQRKAEKEKQHSESCPHCGGELVSEELMHEKQDACYHKVKSRYKVWPSAYASGALVQCRKKGASNWGNGGKKNENVSETPTGLPVEGQPSGRRTYRPKSAGTFAEDTAYAGGMGQGGDAGQSYRKFKPKSAGTFKESAIMAGLKKNDEFLNEGLMQNIGAAALAAALALGASTKANAEPVYVYQDAAGKYSAALSPQDIPNDAVRKLVVDTDDDSVAILKGNSKIPINLAPAIVNNIKQQAGIGVATSAGQQAKTTAQPTQIAKSVDMADGKSLNFTGYSIEEIKEQMINNIESTYPDAEVEDKGRTLTSTRYSVQGKSFGGALMTAVMKGGSGTMDVITRYNFAKVGDTVKVTPQQFLRFTNVFGQPETTDGNASGVIKSWYKHFNQDKIAKPKPVNSFEGRNTLRARA